MGKHYDCVVLTYDVPHRKTYDTLCTIKANGLAHNVLVYAIPMHYKKKFHPIYEHRPVLHRDIDTQKVCENFGYTYVCEKNYDALDVDAMTPVLVCGAGIIPQEFVSSHTVINAHPGYVPLARGLDAFKWAIVEQKPIGVTTHIIGKEVDAGAIVQRVKVPVYRNDTFHAVAQRVYEYEILLLADSLRHWQEDHEYISAGENLLHKRMPAETEKGLLDAFHQYVEKYGVERSYYVGDRDRMENSMMKENSEIGGAEP